MYGIIATFVKDTDYQTPEVI